MKTLRRFVLPLLTCVALASPAFAAADENDGCVKIRARILDAQVTDGCTSPNGFCAAGTVTGNHGLNGTTFFTLDGFVPGPASAPGSFSTSGILVYTTRRGTLTVRETGITGLGPAFPALEVVQSGTGEFEGATGHLWVLGEKVGDHFDSKIRGELCLP
jgi:hypothetical protein